MYICDFSYFIIKIISIAIFSILVYNLILYITNGEKVIYLAENHVEREFMDKAYQAKTLTDKDKAQADKAAAALKQMEEQKQKIMKDRIKKVHKTGHSHINNIINNGPKKK